MTLKSFFLSKSKSRFLTLLSRLFSFHSSSLSPPFRHSSAASFCTSPETPDQLKKPNPKLVNFSPSDTDSDSDATPPATRPDKSKIPPPYNPFSKEPAMKGPDDPKNLQEVFAKIREDGLMNSAAKMFAELSL